MDIQLLVPSVGVFLTLVFAAAGVLVLVKAQANKRIRDRLEDVILLGDTDTSARDVILRDMDLSSIPFLNTLLKNAGWARKLDTLLVQGDLSIRLGTFLLIMLFLFAAGTFVTAAVLDRPLMALPIGLLLGSIPLFYARHKKMKRLQQFEKQFPDALDMLNGALRAGLALTGAIQVVAEESPDPVAKEFRVLFEENRLGLDMKDALKKFAGRVDSKELHLFITAVILQRETGGNLAEILERAAAIIRDRFRILGDVRTLTAQARMSGFILFVLPLVMAGIIMVVAPEYLRGLVADPIGKYLIGMAVALQISGFFIMRRIVNIKV
ncbi:MAG: type II secretion system F family protein [Candidatus Latescibacterota bacterium]|nr:MAG: type II secretion system F family protein [Candidatus Latescibacterota bacterium]